MRIAWTRGVRTWRIAAGLLLLASLCAIGAAPAAAPADLIVNGDFAQRSGAAPTGYRLEGDVEYRYLGDANRDMAGWGVALESGQDLNHDGRIAGSVSQTVKNLNPAAGRWFRFSFRGLPQDGFVADGLFVKIEYFGDGGRTSYDHLAKEIYPDVERARKDLAVNGVRKRGGAAAWRTYETQIRIPFPQVGEAKFTVTFRGGRGGGRNDAAFFVTDFSLTRIEAPAEYQETAAATTQPAGATADQPPPGTLLPLGGRWFYQARAGEQATPRAFDFSNADRLWYHDAVWQTPFVGNMSAVLRAGQKDLRGQVAAKDTPLPRNVTVAFEGAAMVLHTSGIPNHPTGKFPEPAGRGNPSYITMQDSTFYLPLDPKENPNHTVIDEANRNHALNMGPIGVALNGVVFFNPFDMGNTDATDLMDRCCGHPQQEGQYHYHKYPICVNSPWDDQGTGHSGLIGWAFDGFPLYGPYESAGVMAKDVTGPSALNAFNMHYDPERGWHYHVTPGKFPYLIGGYWGTVDSRDIQRPPRGGGASGGMGPPGRGGPGGFGGFGRQRPDGAFPPGPPPPPGDDGQERRGPPPPPDGFGPPEGP